MLNYGKRYNCDLQKNEIQMNFDFNKFETLFLASKRKKTELRTSITVRRHCYFGPRCHTALNSFKHNLHISVLWRWIA